MEILSLSNRLCVGDCSQNVLIQTAKEDFCENERIATWLCHHVCPRVTDSRNSEKDLRYKTSKTPVTQVHYHEAMQRCIFTYYILTKNTNFWITKLYFSRRKQHAMPTYVRTFVFHHDKNWQQQTTTESNFIVKHTSCQQELDTTVGALSHYESAGL